MIDLPIFLPILIAILILRAVLGVSRAEKGRHGVRTCPLCRPTTQLCWEVA